MRSTGPARTLAFEQIERGKPDKQPYFRTLLVLRPIQMIQERGRVWPGWRRPTCPDEGFGVGVVLGEISVDGGLQVGNRAKDAAADALAGDLGKEVLDCIEPGGGVGVKWKSLRVPLCSLDIAR
jgi:hypothetical protein